MIPFSCFLKAQKVFPEYGDNPKWNVLSCFWRDCNTQSFEFYKDTIICGKHYSAILLNKKKTYIRTENQKVFLRETNSCLGKDYVIYDFSKNIGDTIYLAYDLSNTAYLDTIPALISNIDTIDFLNSRRRRFLVKFNPSGQSNFFRQMYWIEGIGSDMHPFYSYIHTFDAWETEYQLLCYSQNNIQLFQNWNYQSCDINTSVRNTQNENKVFVSPNPIADFFDIKHPNSIDLIQIEMFDYTGKKIFCRQGKSIENKRIFMNSKYNSGLYILKIATNFELYTIKIIKE